MQPMWFIGELRRPVHKEVARLEIGLPHSCFHEVLKHCTPGRVQASTLVQQKCYVAAALPKIDNQYKLTTKVNWHSTKPGNQNRLATNLNWLPQCCCLCTPSTATDGRTEAHIRPFSTRKGANSGRAILRTLLRSYSMCKNKQTRVRMLGSLSAALQAKGGCGPSDWRLAAAQQYPPTHRQPRRLLPATKFVTAVGDSGIAVVSPMPMQYSYSECVSIESCNVEAVEAALQVSISRVDDQMCGGDIVIPATGTFLLQGNQGPHSRGTAIHMCAWVL